MNNILIHHGIKGQRWGVRRYQNEDGTLTEAGKKKANQEKYKAAVKKYSKAADDWSREQDANDEAWQNVIKLRKKTGITAIGRFFNTVKGKSPEAQAYSKAYYDWSDRQDILDEKYEEVKKLYAETGRNKVHRIINNIRYDPIKKEDLRFQG